MYNPPPPPGYSHYQPPPQPLSMPPPPANPPPPPPAQRMGVGNHAGDFELFGPPPTLSNATTSVSHRTIPIPSSGSSSESSSIGDGDYPPVPELVADDGNAPSPPVSFSPPSPDTTSTAPAPPPVRPGLLPHSAASKGSSSTSFYGRSGSYHNGGGFERASSVPAPECPRPMRRKTQESRDWPSFYSSSSSSSASSTGGGGSYLQTPGLTDSKPLVVDEPTSFITPTVSTAGATNPFDVSSFALSPPAPQYPFYSASPPYPDHPLLPSEQSDLLDRVRRDLLDVDLSSIKGPLRALALSSGVSEGARQFGGGDRETTPTQNMAAGVGAGGDPTLSSPHHSWNNANAASTAAQHLLRSPAMSSASDATVSPQEAFLDYDEVDSRLHDPSRPRGSDFGASLFAPLPATAPPPPSVALEKRSPPTRDADASSPPPPSAAPTSPILRATSPRAAHAHAHGHGHHHSRRGPHPFSVPQNAVTWAEQRSRSGQRVLVGGDAADDDGDFGTTGGEEEEEEGDAPATKVEEQVEFAAAAVRGGFAAPRPPAESSSSLAPTPTPAAASTPTATPTPAQPQPQPHSVVAAAQEEQDIKPFLVGKSALPPSTTSFNPLLPLEAVSQSVVRSSGSSGGGGGGGGFPGFAPPPPPQTGSGSAQPGMSAFQQELARQRGLGSSSSAVSEGRSGTATPRRSAAATALAGLNQDLYSSVAAPEPEDGTPDLGSSSGGRPQRQRKRSRMAMSAYGDDSEGEGREEVPSSTTSRPLGFAAPPAKSTLPAPPPPPARRSKSVEEEYFDDDGDDFAAAADEGESDESYRSSGSSFGATRRGHKAGGNAPPPNKRRRRAPASNVEGGNKKRSSANSGGSNAPVSSGGIECNHQNADGSICGVIFRRPYDLARHKETIHGEGLKGEKVKAKEWRCEECGGTFSRKDALLRHGRIRGHVTG